MNEKIFAFFNFFIYILTYSFFISPQMLNSNFVTGVGVRAFVSTAVICECWDVGNRLEQNEICLLFLFITV
jgi:hypothetical protein